MESLGTEALVRVIEKSGIRNVTVRLKSDESTRNSNDVGLMETDCRLHSDHSKVLIYKDNRRL